MAWRQTIIERAHLWACSHSKRSTRWLAGISIAGGVLLAVIGVRYLITPEQAAVTFGVPGRPTGYELYYIIGAAQPAGSACWWRACSLCGNGGHWPCGLPWGHSCVSPTPPLRQARRAALPQVAFHIACGRRLRSFWRGVLPGASVGTKRALSCDVGHSTCGFILAVDGARLGPEPRRPIAPSPRPLGWPMGAWQVESAVAAADDRRSCACCSPFLFALPRASTAATLPAPRLIPLFGLAWAMFWTGFLRVGAQSALMLAPPAAALLLLVRWLR